MLTEYLHESRRLRSRAIKSMLGLQAGVEDGLPSDKDTLGRCNTPSAENTRQAPHKLTVSTGSEEDSTTRTLIVASNTPTQSGAGFPSISSRTSSSPNGQFATDISPCGSIPALLGYHPENFPSFLTNWEAFPLDEFELLPDLTQNQPSNNSQYLGHVDRVAAPSDEAATTSFTCGCRSPAPWVALWCPHDKDPKVLFPIFETDALTIPHQSIELLVEYYFKYFHLCSFPVMSEWETYQLMHPKSTLEDQPARPMSLALLNALMFTASAVGGWHIEISVSQVTDLFSMLAMTKPEPLDLMTSARCAPPFMTELGYVRSRSCVGPPLGVRNRHCS